MNGGQPQRQSFGSHDHAGMHLQAANHGVLRTTVAILPGEGSVRDPNCRDIGAVVGECSRVVQDQQGRIVAKRRTASGFIVTGEDRVLGDPIAGKQAVSGLGVRPVLTCKRNAAADASGELLQHAARTPAVPRVLKPASPQLVADPSLGPLLNLA